MIANLALDVGRVRLACDPKQVETLNAAGFDWGSFTRNLSSLMVSGTVPDRKVLQLNVSLIKNACKPEEVAALDRTGFVWEDMAKNLGALLISGDVSAKDVSPKQ